MTSSSTSSLPGYAIFQDSMSCLIEALEWKKGNCDCQKSKDILEIAQKILLGNNDGNIHQKARTEKIDTKKACIKSVATQTVNAERTKLISSKISPKHFHGKILMRPVAIPLHQRDGNLKDPRIFPQVFDKFQSKKDTEPKPKIKKMRLEDDVIRSPSITSDDGLCTDPLEDLKNCSEKQMIESQEIRCVHQAVDPRKKKIEMQDLAIVHFPTDPRLKRSNRSSFNIVSVNQPKMAGNFVDRALSNHIDLFSKPYYPNYGLQSSFSEASINGNSSRLPYQHQRHLEYEDFSIIPPNCWNYWLNYPYDDIPKQANWYSFNKYW